MARKLFEPVMIGNLELRNRLVMPAMVSQYGDSSRFVTQRQINYYVERARNNLGLIIVEATSIAPVGRILPSQIGIYDDAFISKLKKLAESIKHTGTRCFLQLHHAGRRAPPEFNNGAQPVAPSAIPVWLQDMPRRLTLEEIDTLIEAFAQGARRAKEACFDGIEVHGAHGYLIAQFLSPLTNKRTDEYGGDVARRARFAVEICRRIRERVGKNYPLIARICGDEYVKGGLVLRDVQRVAAMLEEAGVNAIDVSAGFEGFSSEEGYLGAPLAHPVAPMSRPHGCFVHLADGIKKAVKVPVIAVGRLDDPYLAEATVAQGRADLVAIGRGLIADPAIGTKFLRRRNSDIRRCIACDFCLISIGVSVRGQANLTCAVNAEVGKEEEYQIKPALKPKKVLVVGGGPGGMEAARVAALRGHRVTLMERKPHLGGNLVAAGAASFKRDIRYAADYLSNAIDKLGVGICLDTEANEENVLALNPDVVILATGALSEMPAIPGVERDNVTEALAVLEGNAQTGSRVVVVGAGMIGCETAVYLAESGKGVTIVSRRDTDFSDTGGLAPDMEPVIRRWFLVDLWPHLPILAVGRSTFQEVTNEGLIVQDIEGKRSLIPGDTIVFAIGMKPSNYLKARLDGKVPELYQVGDCVKPRQIVDAIGDAARIGRLI